MHAWSVIGNSVTHGIPLVVFENGKYISVGFQLLAIPADLPQSNTPSLDPCVTKLAVAVTGSSSLIGKLLRRKELHILLPGEDSDVAIVRWRIDSGYNLIKADGIQILHVEEGLSYYNRADMPPTRAAIYTHPSARELTFVLEPGQIISAYGEMADETQVSHHGYTLKWTGKKVIVDDLSRSYYKNVAQKGKNGKSKIIKIYE